MVTDYTANNISACTWQSRSRSENAKRATVAPFLVSKYFQRSISLQLIALLVLQQC